MLLLFGGARLAGLGKSTGRAIKEFKEETKGLKEGDADRAPRPRSRPASLQSDSAYQPSRQSTRARASNPPAR